MTDNHPNLPGMIGYTGLVLALNCTLALARRGILEAEEIAICSKAIRDLAVFADTLGDGQQFAPPAISEALHCAWQQLQGFDQA